MFQQCRNLTPSETLWRDVTTSSKSVSVTIAKCVTYIIQVGCHSEQEDGSSITQCVCSEDLCNGPVSAVDVNHSTKTESFYVNIILLLFISALLNDRRGKKGLWVKINNSILILITNISVDSFTITWIECRLDFCSGLWLVWLFCLVLETN